MIAFCCVAHFPTGRHLASDVGVYRTNGNAIDRSVKSASSDIGMPCERTFVPAIYGFLCHRCGASGGIEASCSGEGRIRTRPACLRKTLEVSCCPYCALSSHFCRLVAVRHPTRVTAFFPYITVALIWSTGPKPKDAHHHEPAMGSTQCSASVIARC